MSGASEPMGWCTNWSAYGMRQLYEMVANEDNERGWQQTTTWRTLEESVRAQRDRLVACKEALMETWPPEKSPAAAAFIAQIDDLTASMTQTSLAASRNMVGLDGVLTALADAKRKMESLSGQYKDASGDWIPSFVDDAEDELTEQARQVMAEADRAAQDHAEYLEPIPTYRLRPVVKPGSPDGEDGSHPTGTGVDTPPVHQPPDPITGRDPVMPDGRDWVGTNPDGSPINPGQPIGSGPGLVGVGPTPAPIGSPMPGPITGPGVPTPSPIMPGSGPVPSVIMPSGPVIGPTGAMGGRAGSPRANMPGVPGMPGSAGRPGGVGASGARAGMSRGVMPPGGVIGAPTGGRPGAGATRPGAAGGRPVGATGAMPVGGTAAAGRGRRPGDSETVENHGDPDNPWQVAEGVPPVINPPDAPAPPDPGPGVIGLDW